MPVLSILDFSTGLYEARLWFLFLLNKIIKGKNMTTVPKCYAKKKEYPGTRLPPSFE